MIKINSFLCSLQNNNDDNDILQSIKLYERYSVILTILLEIFIICTNIVQVIESF